MVQELGSTDARRRILKGFFDLRRVLQDAGFRGFHWVDGSFVEKGDHEPRDIDVVSFLAGPDDWETNPRSIPPLYGDAAKQRFQTDHYIVDQMYHPEDLVNRTVYWYELWSTRREDRGGGRKGFLHLDLHDLSEDRAIELLQEDP